MIKSDENIERLWNTLITRIACLSIGHVVKNVDIDYILAQVTLCQSFLAASSNAKYIKKIATNFAKSEKIKPAKLRRTTACKKLLTNW